MFNKTPQAVMAISLIPHALNSTIENNFVHRTELVSGSFILIFTEDYSLG
jgi:hypothetical protein